MSSFLSGATLYLSDIELIPNRLLLCNNNVDNRLWNRSSQKYDPCVRDVAHLIYTEEGNKN